MTSGWRRSRLTAARTGPRTRTAPLPGPCPPRARRTRHRPPPAARKEDPHAAVRRPAPPPARALPRRPGPGPLLLARVSAAAAARHGVTIQAEALLDDQHLLLLIVQAPSPQAVHQFLAFLPGPGDLQVLPACTAEQAVQRGGCGPAPPPAP